MPAVAVIRRRLVLFMFNRFKGYLDGRSSFPSRIKKERIKEEKRTNLLELLTMGLLSTAGVEMKSHYT